MDDVGFSVSLPEVQYSLSLSSLTTSAGARDFSSSTEELVL